MSKLEMIEAIRRFNQTVETEFLEDFEDQQLDSYLRRLEHVKDQRGPASGWVREADTPAVVMRRARGL